MLNVESSFVQEGRLIDYTPGVPVASGEVVVQVNLLGISSLAIAANVMGSLAVEGVFNFVKTPGVAIAVGEYVYWDDTANEANKTSTGNTVIGKCVRDATAGAPTVWVKLGGASATSELFVILPTKDLRIYSTTPTTNYDEFWLRVGRQGGFYRSLFHFDLTSHLGKTVVSATMNLVSTFELSPTTPSKLKRMTTTTWGETTATFNTSDGVTAWSPANDDSPQTGPYTETGAIAIGLPAGALLDNYHPFDITGIVGLAQDALDNRGGHLYLILMSDNEVSGRSAEFLDSELGYPGQSGPTLTLVVA